MHLIRFKAAFLKTRIIQIAALLLAALFSPGCEDSTVLYGPAPVPSPIPTPQSCVTNPKTYYGPMPCQTDQECVDKFGATWYCNKDYIIDKECNVKWPSCVKR